MSEAHPTIPHPKFKHGFSRNPIYKIWRSMLSRCHDPASADYVYYGGRGIHVCDRWRESFVAFRDELGERPSNKHSLERLDNSKGYCPDNCKWATTTEQSRNRRYNIPMTFRGETLIAIEWCERLNICPPTLYNRLRRGWTVEEALSRPANVHERRPQFKRKSGPSRRRT